MAAHRSLSSRIGHPRRSRFGRRPRPELHVRRGIVRLADGTFWIADENGPSLMHFSADGRMILRHVPRGTEDDYAGARYDVKGTLPAILARRSANSFVKASAMSKRAVIPLG